MIDASLVSSSITPAQDPTSTAYIMHTGELMNILAALIFLGLYVYPPTVEAIFAIHGSIDIHPSQVKYTMMICSVHSPTQAHLLCAHFHLLARNKDLSKLVR